MKVRLGFVSNSSSSSFMLAIRKGFDENALIIQAGWLGGVAKDIFEFCKREGELLTLDEWVEYKISRRFSSEERIKYPGQVTTDTKYYREMVMEDIPDHEKYDLYFGKCSNDGGEWVSSALYDGSIGIDTYEVKLWAEE